MQRGNAALSTAGTATVIACYAGQGARRLIATQPLKDFLYLLIILEDILQLVLAGSTQFSTCWLHKLRTTGSRACRGLRRGLRRGAWFPAFGLNNRSIR